MTFEEWFHKEYEPADLQLKQYAERKDVFIKNGKLSGFWRLFAKKNPLDKRIHYLLEKQKDFLK